MWNTYTIGACVLLLVLATCGPTTPIETFGFRPGAAAAENVLISIQSVVPVGISTTDKPVRSTGTAQSPWPMFRGDAQHTGRSVYQGPQKPATRWSYKAGNIVRSAVVGGDGTIYVGSYDSTLYAINPDGTLNWSRKTGGRISSSPAVASDGTIYVGSYDHSR